SILQPWLNQEEKKNQRSQRSMLNQKAFGIIQDGIKKIVFFKKREHNHFHQLMNYLGRRSKFSGVLRISGSRESLGKNIQMEATLFIIQMVIRGENFWVMDKILGE